MPRLLSLCAGLGMIAGLSGVALAQTVAPDALPAQALSTPDAPAPAQPEVAVPTEPVAPVPAAAPVQAAPVQAAPEAPAVPALLPPAEVAPSDTATSAASAAPPAPAPAHDLSPWGMYEQADAVVKGVMIALAIACFLTWTVFLYKLVEIGFAKARAVRAARLLSRAGSLSDAVGALGKGHDPARSLTRAIHQEYDRSAQVLDAAGAEGLKERAVSIVGRVDQQAAARLRRGMGLLATIGSVSPFVGLFGTVWGIMNSFIGIAESGTTNLAVVAPGIAEALFATAIGLVAAIPAVVIYNHFTRAIAAYKLALGDAGAAALRLLSRDIDFRARQGA